MQCEMEDIDGSEDWGSFQPGGEFKTQTEKDDNNPNEVYNENTGGVSFKVEDEMKLLRFLVLGSEGATYYGHSEKEVTRDHITCIDRLIMLDRGPVVVETIKDVSCHGRASKDKSALHALAICARSNDLDTKRAAYSVLSDVCRIPTQLFMFIMYCEQESAGTGWGRSHRNAIIRWYENYASAHDGLKLAKHVTKYANRHNWSHRDVLRLAHMKTSSPMVKFVVLYVVKGLQAAKTMIPTNLSESDARAVNNVRDYLEAVDRTKKSKDETEVLNMLSQYHLFREHIPTFMLKDSIPIWSALLRDMPMNALVRNLGKMSSLDMLKAGSEGEKIVLEKLADENQIKYSRLHPFKILVAMKTYQKGSGDKGTLIWPKNPNITLALDAAFYKSFKYIKPTGKRYLLAIDISGSMGVPLMGISSVTARDAATAMMMVTLKTEEKFEVLPFSYTTPKKLDVRKEDTLSFVQSKCNSLPFGATDCSLPMMYAMQHKKRFDVFVVYTDSETYFGNIKPSDALREYRKVSGVKDARLIVVGMTSNGFTIADPTDPYMLDIVGFDSEAPEAMRNFVMDYGLKGEKEDHKETMDDNTETKMIEDY